MEKERNIFYQAASIKNEIDSFLVGYKNDSLEIKRCDLLNFITLDNEGFIHSVDFWLKTLRNGSSDVCNRSNQIIHFLRQNNLMIYDPKKHFYQLTPKGLEAKNEIVEMLNQRSPLFQDEDLRIKMAQLSSDLRRARHADSSST